jgi:outer membrane protein assembly factor BamB
MVEAPKKGTPLPQYALLKLAQWGRRLLSSRQPMRVLKMIPRVPLLILSLSFVGASLTNGARAGDFDWAYWRGPQMNGHSTLKNLPDTWDPAGGEGSNLLWKRDDMGTRSTPVCLNNKLYFLARHSAGTVNDGERVVCLNAETGETVWEHRFNVYLSDVPAERVGWSNVVADPETGDVFALGVCGLFLCLDGETGEVKWQHSMHEEYGLLSTYGGRTNSPIIHENNVLISAVFIGWGEKSRPQDHYIAFDKRNGQPVWYEGTRPLPNDTTYSGPVLTTFDGEAAVVFGSGDGGVHAFQPRTGKRLWWYDVTSRGINTTPLVVDGKVYCGHSEENLDDTKMGAVFCLDGTKRGNLNEDGEVWRVKELFFGKCAPLMIDNLLYVIDDRAKLHILNPETGETVGFERLGTVQRSSPLYADGKIYTCTADGRFYTLKPDGKGGVEILHRMRVRGESNGSIIAAQGRLYIPLSDGMYCVGTGQPPQGDSPTSPLAEEVSREDDTTPAQLQVVPVESLLTSGEGQSFQVRLYNAKGQWLRNADIGEARISHEGIGSVDGDGTFSTRGGNREHGAAIITAKVGELEGQARVRVVPPLDWQFDFDSGVIPVTWVGARYRHIPLDFDLYQKLTKEDPQAGQLYIFLSTGFINSGQNQSVYDDTTPAQRWTETLRYLGMLGEGEKPRTAEEAREKLGLSLKRLVAEKVLESYDFTTWQRDLGGDKSADEIRLTVTRGERRVDGNGVMTKIQTIPLGARSQGWMGLTNLSDYTIQADVYGTTKEGKLPDIGLIAQRYTIDMMGASQQLQIRTWTPQLRMARTVPLEWKSDTWYTLKFQASVEDGKAVLRGKVWEKGQSEPADWMVTAEDDPGEHNGSPGLFGNARDAEIFYDNIIVRKNDES